MTEAKQTLTGQAAIDCTESRWLTQLIEAGRCPDQSENWTLPRAPTYKIVKTFVPRDDPQVSYPARLITGREADASIGTEHRSIQDAYDHAMRTATENSSHGASIGAVQVTTRDSHGSFFGRHSDEMEALGSFVCRHCGERILPRHIYAAKLTAKHQCAHKGRVHEK